MTHFMTQFAEELGADFHGRSSVAEDVFGRHIPELSGGVVDKVFVAHGSSVFALRSSVFGLRSSLFALRALRFALCASRFASRL